MKRMLAVGVILELYWGCMGIYGKEHRNYYLGLGV